MVAPVPNKVVLRDQQYQVEYTRGNPELDPNPPEPVSQHLHTFQRTLNSLGREIATPSELSTILQELTQVRAQLADFKQLHTAILQRMAFATMDPRHVPVYLQRQLPQLIQEIKTRQGLQEDVTFTSLTPLIENALQRENELVNNLNLHRLQLEQREMSHATEAVLPGAAVLNIMLQDMRHHLNALQEGSTEPKPLEPLAMLKGRVEQMETSLRAIIQKGLKSQLGSGAATPSMQISAADGLHLMTFGDQSTHPASEYLGQNDFAVSQLALRSVFLSLQETELGPKMVEISTTLANQTQDLTTLQSDLRTATEGSQRIAAYDKALQGPQYNQGTTVDLDDEQHFISDVKRWWNETRTQIVTIYDKHNLQSPHRGQQLKKKTEAAAATLAQTKAQEKELSFALKQAQIAQAMSTLAEVTRLRHTLQGTRRALEQFQTQTHTERGMGGRFVLALKEKTGFSEKRTETITQLVRRATATEAQLERISQTALSKAGLCAS